MNTLLKKGFSLFIVICLLFAYVIVPVEAEINSEFAGGTGTLDDPYLISTAIQLYNIRNYLDKHFLLTNNIDLVGYSEGAGWDPIDNFSGTLDGSENQYTISNLTINREDENDIGLFGSTAGYDSKIQNIGLVNVSIKGDEDVGGLVGYNYSDILNCYVTGYVDGQVNTGGLVGYSVIGSIKDCYSLCDVNFISSHFSYRNTGGLVGYLFQDTIDSCFAKGRVYGTEYTGGLVGYSYIGKVLKCYTESIIYGYYEVGGLIGCNGRGYENWGMFANCYTNCRIKGRNNVGGLVGISYGAIVNSYSVSSLVPRNPVYDLMYGIGSSKISSSYWNIDTAGILPPYDEGYKTTTDMKQKSTYEGWDFGSVWGMNSLNNNGYPFLQWQEYTDNTIPQISSYRTSSIDNTSVVFEIMVDEPGTYYYLVYASEAPSPSVNEIINQGVCESKGSGFTSIGFNTINIQNLEVDTMYKVYLIVKDTTGNTSDIAEYEFTTRYNGYTIPNRKASVESQNSVEVDIDTSYEIDLGAVFEDYDNGYLSYVVSINDGLFVLADKEYTYKPIDKSEITLLFKAYDGLSYSIDTYEVSIIPTTTFSGGSGTQFNPYLISTSQQLSYLRFNGEPYTYFEIINDIDLSDYSEGKGWKPIDSFSGILDGKQHIISNLTIRRPDENYIGLFSSSEGTISGIKLINVNIVGYSKVGGICGGYSYDSWACQGEINQCYVSGRITGHNYVGGVIGYGWPKISNCYTKVDISGNDHIGGIVGSIAGGEYWGHPYNWVSLLECHSSGVIIGNNYVGGIAGSTFVRQMHYNTYGYFYSVIRNSFSSCSVEGVGYVGGLIGTNCGEVANCYSSGLVRGSSNTGGLVGLNTKIYLQDGSYAEFAKAINCYWNMDTSEISISAVGVGINESDMKNKQTFVDWDFDSIWDINSDRNLGYPFLRWNVGVLYGDVTGDGTVNSQDVTFLRRYLIGGWGVTIDTIAADVNKDGFINNQDVTLLRRYLIGGWGITLD